MKNMKNIGALKKKLAELMNEHRELDKKITLLCESGASDQVEIQRLKKRKLIIKDRIMQIENKLLPDIIA